MEFSKGDTAASSGCWNYATLKTELVAALAALDPVGPALRVKSSLEVDCSASALEIHTVSGDDIPDASETAIEETVAAHTANPDPD